MNDPGIDPPIYDEHTSLALNINKGYRRGYYGEYLYDIPEQSRLRVMDNEGHPASGVTVRLYQRSSDQGSYGGRFGTIDNEAEISGVTDGDGLLLLPNRTVGTPTSTNTGHTLRDNPFGPIDVVGRNDEFILELSKSTHQEYHWLDITAFNLIAWQQLSDSTLGIASNVPPDEAPATTARLSGLLEFGLVKLEWLPSPSSDVVGYNIYRAKSPAYEYQRIVNQTTASTYSEAYDDSQRVVNYAVTAVDDQGRESGFSDLFYALRVINPAAIAVEGPGGRIVLDPQNGYALLYQATGGTFVDTRSSYDNHLEFSFYMLRDVQGRLIVSHPGDAYTARQSVRVFDEEFRLSWSLARRALPPASSRALRGSQCGANPADPTPVVSWWQTAGTIESRFSTRMGIS